VLVASVDFAQPEALTDAANAGQCDGICSRVAPPPDVRVHMERGSREAWADACSAEESSQSEDGLDNLSSNNGEVLTTLSRREVQEHLEAVHALAGRVASLELQLRQPAPFSRGSTRNGRRNNKTQAPARHTRVASKLQFCVPRALESANIHVGYNNGDVEYITIKDEPCDARSIRQMAKRFRMQVRVESRSFYFEEGNDEHTSTILVLAANDKFSHVRAAYVADRSAVTNDGRLVYQHPFTLQDLPTNTLVSSSAAILSFPGALGFKDNLADGAQKDRASECQSYLGGGTELSQTVQVHCMMEYVDGDAQIGNVFRSMGRVAKTLVKKNPLTAGVYDVGDMAAKGLRKKKKSVLPAEAKLPSALKVPDEQVLRKVNPPPVVRERNIRMAELGDGNMIKLGPGSVLTLTGNARLTRSGMKFVLTGNSPRLSVQPSTEIGVPNKRRTRRKINARSQCEFDVIVDTGLMRSKLPGKGPYTKTGYFICGSFRYRPGVVCDFWDRDHAQIGPDLLHCSEQFEWQDQDGLWHTKDTGSDISYTPLPPTHWSPVPFGVNGKPVRSLLRVEENESFLHVPELPRVIHAASYILQADDAVFSFQPKFHSVPVYPIAGVCQMESDKPLGLKSSTSKIGRVGKHKVPIGEDFIGYDFPELTAAGAKVLLKIVIWCGEHYIHGTGTASAQFVHVASQGLVQTLHFVGLNKMEIEAIEQHFGCKLQFCRPKPVVKEVADYFVRNHAPQINSPLDSTCQMEILSGLNSDYPKESLTGWFKAVTATLPADAVSKVTELHQYLKQTLLPMVKDNHVPLPSGASRVSALPSLVTTEVSPMVGFTTRNFGVLGFPNVSNNIGVLSSSVPGVYPLSNFALDTTGLSLTSRYNFQSYPTSFVNSNFNVAPGTTVSMVLPVSSSFSVNGGGFKSLATARTNAGARVTSLTGYQTGYSPRVAGGAPLMISCSSADIIEIELQHNINAPTLATVTVNVIVIYYLSTGVISNVSTTIFTNTGQLTDAGVGLGISVNPPTNAVGILGSMVTLVTSGSGFNISYALTSFNFTLLSATSTYNQNVPFGDYTVNASPLLATLLTATQASSTYQNSALAILVSNTSAINYLSGDSVTAVLPPGDPGEYCGMDPSVMEQFFGTRSAFFGSGAYAVANTLRYFNLYGHTVPLNANYQFASESLAFLAELPAPTAGSYSCRVMLGASFEVITESQVLRPTNVRSDVVVMDALSTLFAPENIITDNPNHIKLLTKHIKEVLSAAINKEFDGMTYDKATKVLRRRRKGRRPSVGTQKAGPQIAVKPEAEFDCEAEDMDGEAEEGVDAEGDYSRRRSTRRARGRRSRSRSRSRSRTRFMSYR